MEEKIPTTLFYTDDDADDLDFFEEVAGELNEAVSLFAEGGKLLERLYNPPPKASLIFLDLNMPVKTGFDVLREIKASPSLKDIPAIILTTSISPDDVKLSKSLGATLYIRKPASVNALKKAITYVLSIDWENFTTSDKDFVYQP